MRIAICDDELFQIQLMETYIKKWATQNNIVINLCTFPNAESFFFEWSSKTNFDIIFLDIQMKHMSGMDLAEIIRKLDNHLIIVFITGLKEYVFRGYEVKALHYLIKPVKEKDCHKCLNDAYTLIQKRRSNTLLIPVNSQIRKFYYDDIYYFEVFSHYIDVHINEKVYKYKKKISDLENELPSNQFIRCHRSCIVNIIYIKAIDKKFLVMDNGVELIVSKDRWHATNQAFLDYYSKNKELKL